ncbi:hypothetical protein [Mangrovicoccus sp. HB161399]|uniref:hypothetical protein n=1 Tax=Mangrovicoccus sp. HB161399 TaxID=2720392 RepID=UPI001551F75A|nr:hypothetical protein [Mangrovicoccus sp. HB161399]
MKPIHLLLGAACALAAPAAEAATVHAEASYEIKSLRSYTVAPEVMPIVPYAETSQDGTGTAAADAVQGRVTADAATSGRSGVPMDYAHAQVISTERITFANGGSTLGTFYSAVTIGFSLSIEGNNDGQSLPEGMFGELGTARATVNAYLERILADGSVISGGNPVWTKEMLFNQTGSYDNPAFVTTAMNANVNPGETVSIVFELSAYADAWHGDPLGGPVSGPSEVPLPGGLLLMPGGLAMLLGVRRLRTARRA